MADKPLVNLWASFLDNHGLSPGKVEISVLLRLAELLAAKEGPRVRPHTLRLKSRRLVCVTAMENGIDLPSYRYRGREPCRVGSGPHVLQSITVYLSKDNVERLTKYIDLRTKGLGQAGQIRDRISSRRAQGQLYREQGRTSWMW